MNLDDYANWHFVSGSYTAGNSGETVLGSSGDDTITGGTGNDVIHGMGGSDTLNGGDGNDLIHGGSGDDTIDGGDGNDTIWGGGNDIIDGGAGTNTVSYGDAPDAVTVDLSIGTATHADSSTDSLTNIQNVVGSGYDDTFILTGANNVIDGGAGHDTVDYSNYVCDYYQDVYVNLSTGVATDYYSNFTDTLTSIENVTGSAYNDKLHAGANGSVLLGGDGDDALFDGSGNDVMDGGEGTNEYYFSHGSDIIHDVTLQMSQIRMAGTPLISTMSTSQTLRSLSLIQRT